ncbi:hypothetical protein [Niveispirillum cyanobacteriorum]|uniref:Uncharacterized protein n=1 Tax=Niveispirillum cyanobacteriorum TaxID=1612173 RepID=A0A2K9NCY6_9PROT|nr:hypothetical protein [Niveispirillum cyanobacteriorum]AUN30964.1 hypothetical protein C0V82_12455 [Niveispirillum cyanobacteriorum]GGE81149.1 hypothetical protein GCM10011317_42950 [Niveispirillum cyanobacteriorum]
MQPNLEGLSLRQRQDAIRAAMAANEGGPAASRSAPNDFAASSPRLMAGYKSRAADEPTWAKIAFHLAAGVPIIKIAEHYKLSRTTIWRAISQSPNLRRRIAEERALMRREADSRFVAMRELVVDTIYRAVADGNLRATLWAAERLGIGDTLLQQAEKPPKPGYARMPQGWWPSATQEGAILADLATPPGPDTPLPIMEESPAPEPQTGLRPPGPIRPAVAARPDPLPPSSQPSSSSPLPSSSRRKPGPRGLTPDPTALNPTNASETDGAPDPWVPAFAGMTKGDELTERAAGGVAKPPQKRTHPYRATNRPHPNPPRTPRRAAPIRHPQTSVRLLAWLLHNSRPDADGPDGIPGLTAARLVAHANWLALKGKHRDLD